MGTTLSMFSVSEIKGIYLFIYIHLILGFVACSKKSSRKVKSKKMSRWYKFKGNKKTLKIVNQILVYIVCHNPLL